MNGPYKKRRRDDKTKNWGYKGYSTKPIAKKKYVPKGYVPKVLGRTSLSEVKLRDWALASTALVNTGALAYITPTYIGAGGAGLGTGYTCINLLEQGSQVSQRIGDKVVMKSIRIQFNLVANPAATSADVGVVRFCLIFDKNPNGVAPAVSDIFSTLNGAGAYGGIYFNTGIKSANINRFTLLADQKIKIAYGEDQVQTVDIYKKLKMVSKYQSSASPPVIANITEGAIYFMIWSTGYTNAPSIGNFETRLRYWD